MYEDGILQRVGKLSRSVQQEFEENEGGAWLQQLSYVTLTEHPAKPKEEWPAIEKYEKAKAHQTA